MTDAQTAYLLCGALIVLLTLRVPIGPALIGVSFVGIGLVANWIAAWNALGLLPFHFTANWVLASVPAFLFMGFLAYHADLTRGLFNAARLWLAWLPGGTAVATVIGCAGFASVSGSSVACSAAMGRIAVPEMQKLRYDMSLATGAVAAGGTIGALIPPSILFILYGIIAQVPIGQLFLAGLVIGVLSTLFYAAVIILQVKINPALAPGAPEPSTWQERFRALLDTAPILVIAGGVLGGLGFGLFTPTEAGAIGAALVALVGLVRATLTWKAIRNSTRETVSATGALIIIGAGATLFTRILALSGVGDDISSVVLGFGANDVLIMLALVVVYLVLGMFLEPVGAMLLTLPVILPIVTKTDFSLVWFGVFLAKMLEIGMITPPVGMNVFVIKGVVGKAASLATIFKGVAWFVVADLCLVALILLSPSIVLFIVT